MYWSRRVLQIFDTHIIQNNTLDFTDNTAKELVEEAFERKTIDAIILMTILLWINIPKIIQFTQSLRRGIELGRVILNDS